jgi:hypothetical protein
MVRFESVNKGAHSLGKGVENLDPESLFEKLELRSQAASWSTGAPEYEFETPFTQAEGVSRETVEPLREKTGFVVIAGLADALDGSPLANSVESIIAPETKALIFLFTLLFSKYIDSSVKGFYRLSFLQ